MCWNSDQESILTRLELDPQRMPCGRRRGWYKLVGVLGLVGGKRAPTFLCLLGAGECWSLAGQSIRWRWFTYDACCYAAGLVGETALADWVACRKRLPSYSHVFEKSRLLPLDFQ